MLVTLPSRFIDKFYGKTSGEIDAIVEEALEAYFSETKTEAVAVDTVSDFKADLTLRLMMEVADKLDAIQSQGLQVVQQVALPEPVKEEVKYEEPEFIKGSAGEDALDDFLFDIIK